MEIIEVNSSDVTSSGMGSDYGSGMIVGFGSISILVSGLDPFTNYIFYVVAVTISPSEPSDNVTVKTDEAGNHCEILQLGSFYLASTLINAHCVLLGTVLLEIWILD